MAQKEKPTHTIPNGRIQAAIWKNRRADGREWFNVTFTRSYKVGDKWEDTASFGREDLPVLALTAVQAFAWIWGQSVPAQSDRDVE